MYQGRHHLKHHNFSRVATTSCTILFWRMILPVRFGSWHHLQRLLARSCACARLVCARDTFAPRTAARAVHLIWRTSSSTSNRRISMSNCRARDSTLHGYLNQPPLSWGIWVTWHTIVGAQARCVQTSFDLCFSGLWRHPIFQNRLASRWSHSGLERQPGSLSWAHKWQVTPKMVLEG